MIEVFFDCSSPWTYLAFTNLRKLCGDLGETINWRPILVGGILNTINPSVYCAAEWSRKLAGGNRVVLAVLGQRKIFLIGAEDGIPRPR